MFTVCIVDEGGNIDKTLSSLSENDSTLIREVIFSGDSSSIKENYGLNIKSLNLRTDNKAYIKNIFLSEANSDYILMLSSNSVLEDSTLEEIAETLDETPDADVIYPNEVLTQGGEEIVRNFDDFYGKELLLFQSLSIEDNLPEFGILLKKDTFLKLGGFNEEFEDFDFYRFLYENLTSIKLKQSDLSFVEYHINNAFIDTSYRSKTIRDILEMYDWKSIIFPHLSWEKNRNMALATAYTIIGDRIGRYHDLLNASEFYRKALLSLHNKLSLLSLINTYINMGLFDKADILISKEQGLSDEEVGSLKEKVKFARNLIESLEKSVKEGKTGEILIASEDIISVYQGAPIYNIYGVIHYLMNDLENAYRFFYKATIMNPLEEDILRNLIDVAKVLKKEEKVKNLINRLVPQVEKV